VKGTAVETLRVAYRSSREIVTFAMGLLGDLREDDTPPLTVRSGPPVELFRFTDHGQAIAVLADALRDLMRAEPFASVVLLSPSVSASTMYFEGLKKAEVPRLRQVTEEDFSFRPGIEITEVSQVKGLEFDYVILVDASQAAWSDTPSARRLLHVAASRAVHQLWVTSVGTPSVIIRQAIEDL
jgi:DNA helicase-2/ATP-dependent DNA helicase PcrA